MPVGDQIWLLPELPELRVRLLSCGQVGMVEESCTAALSGAAADANVSIPPWVAQETDAHTCQELQGILKCVHEILTARWGSELSLQLARVLIFFLSRRRELQ